MKRPSSIIRTLSSLRPRSSLRLASPATVSPLPEQSYFDQQMTVYLSNLNQQNEHIKSSHKLDISTSWLLDFLDASIIAQKLAQDSLPLDVNRDGLDHEVVDVYLEENVQLLDSCNMLLEKMEIIHKYIDSLRVAMHLLDQGRSLNQTSKERVQRLLDTRNLESCSKSTGPNMRKSVLGQSHVTEALSGSKALASIVCHLLELGLSTKSSKKNSSPRKMKSRPTSAWSNTLVQLQNSVGADMKHHKGCNSLMMPELRRMMLEVRLLNGRVAKADDGTMIMRNDVEGLRRSCDELEQVVLEPLERGVKELYRELISIRMALL